MLKTVFVLVYNALTAGNPQPTNICLTTIQSYSNIEQMVVMTSPQSSNYPSNPLSCDYDLGTWRTICICILL